MPARVAALALASLGGAIAASTPSCEGNATCAPQLEDDSLMQVRRHGVQSGSPGPGFALNSKPYLSKGKALVGAEAGAIIINEDGVDNTYYLPGATTIDGGRTVRYTPPYRFYLMRSPTTDYGNSANFYKPIFPGKTFSVDIDFKGNGPSCGCNLNFYLVSMPGHSIGKDGDWYCDAQCFPGLGCCHEFDMNEGNKVVQQITNHACTHDYNGHPDWACNKWGDPEAKTHSSDFNAGPGATIDSNKKFTFSQRFDISGGDFTFTTTMSQEGRQVVMRMGPGSSQLMNMLGELQKGMAFVTGYWFDQSMNWMDSEVCGQGAEHCNMNPAYISNWRITSNDGPAPPSPPGPAPPSSGGCCKFGDDCGDCGDDNTGWCHQSAANCEECSGEFDPSAPAPSCTGGPAPPAPVPSPPAPTPPSPPVSGGCCKFGDDCGDCGEDNTGWCHQSAANCEDCTGEFDPSAPAPSCDGAPAPPAPVPSPPAPTPPSPLPTPPLPQVFCNPHTTPPQRCPNGDLCPDCGRIACLCP